MKDKLLLLDLGNTRAKWCLTSREADADWGAFSGAMHHIDSPFSLVGKGHLEALLAQKDSITHIILCNVTEPTIEDLWQKWLLQSFPSIPIAAFTSTADYPKLQNLYQEPGDLGNDRWAAIIGASYFTDHASYLVVNSGTATTIDLVHANGQFKGGWILPGINMMLQALGSKTALLPNLSHGTQYLFGDALFGNSTETAILQGVLHAQLGAIHHALNAHPQIRFIVLSGGNAGVLEQHLQLDSQAQCCVIMDPFIIFRGLKLWYQQRLL